MAPGPTGALRKFPAPEFTLFPTLPAVLSKRSSAVLPAVEAGQTPARQRQSRWWTGQWHWHGDDGAGFFTTTLTGTRPAKGLTTFDPCRSAWILTIPQGDGYDL